MTDTDVTQTAADRFHRWLLNFTLVIQELRDSELRELNESLENLLANPTGALEHPVKKASKWIVLMHELQMTHAAYTRMLFGDQIAAVRDFEVSTRIRHEFDEHNQLVPTDVEFLKTHFPEPFLASVFDLLWRHVKDTDLESVAILELKRVTVDKIPGSWIREDRLPYNGRFAVTALLHERRDACDICQEFACVPFPSCWFCSDSPPYHH